MSYFSDKTKNKSSEGATVSASQSFSFSGKAIVDAVAQKAVDRECKYPQQAKVRHYDKFEPYGLD